MFSLFVFYVCRKSDSSGERQRRDLSSQIYVNDSATFNLAKNHSQYKPGNDTPLKKYELFPTVKDNTEKEEPENKISKMDATNTSYVFLYMEVNASVFTVTLKPLKHYTLYSITVKACHDGVEEQVNGTSDDKKPKNFQSGYYRCGRCF